MSTKTIAALFVVVSILFIMAVAAEVFIDSYMKPSSLFGYLLVTTLLSGVMASVVVEKINSQALRQPA